jgi:hypothetical protein
MEEALANYLLGASGITDLVVDRITCGTLPQGEAVPAIVLNKIDGLPEYSDEGEAGLSSARIQIDSYADTYAAAKSVARAVKALLSGASFEQDRIKFDTFIEDEQDSFEEATGPDRRFRVRLDITAWHS